MAGAGAGAISVTLVGAMSGSGDVTEAGVGAAAMAWAGTMVGAMSWSGDMAGAGAISGAGTEK